MNEHAFLMSVIDINHNEILIYKIKYVHTLLSFLILFLFLFFLNKIFFITIPIAMSYFDVDELTKLNTRKSFKYLRQSEKIKAVCLIDIDFF